MSPSYSIYPRIFLHTERINNSIVFVLDGSSIFPLYYNDTFINDAPILYKSILYGGICVTLFVGIIAYLKNTSSDLISSGSYESLNPQVLLEQINDYRFAQGLSGFAASGPLMKMAQLKADDMASHQYYGHLDARGENIFQENPHYTIGEGNVGETLSLGFDTPTEVVEAWSHDPASLRSLDSSVDTDAGIGIARGRWSDGSIKTFVVLEIGSSEE